MIYVFSGPIGSGKTTRLEKWIKGREDVSGILMPVLDGIRFIYSISSKKLFPIDADKNEDPEKIVNIGKYFFSKELFDWGNEEIIKSAETGEEILIIDEIGPLELRGEGFAPALRKVLDIFSQKGKILVIVIRKGLVEEVTGHFRISEYTLLPSLKELDQLLSKKKGSAG